MLHTPSPGISSQSPASGNLAWLCNAGSLKGEKKLQLLKGIAVPQPQSQSYCALPVGVGDLEEQLWLQKVKEALLLIFRHEDTG